MRVILVGSGAALHFLARTFRGKGHAVTIIAADAAECARLARQQDATVVHGDGSDERILEEAGARSSDLVLAATTSDPDNLILCRVARARFGVPRVVALVNDPDNQPVFEQLGVEAISTSLTVASLIEQRAALDQVTHLIPAADGKVTIFEVVLVEDSPAVGRRLAEIDLPRESNVAVLVRGEDTLIPRGDTELLAGDRVLLVCLAEARDRALARLTG